MTTTDTPKTPAEFVAVMLRSSIEADLLVMEHINDPTVMQAETHACINGFIAATAMENLRRIDPDAAATIAERLDQIITAGEVRGPAIRAAKRLGLNPDRWIDEFEERAARRGAKPKAGRRAAYAALTSLADRYEEIADRAPEHPDTLYVDSLTPAQRAEHDRAAGYRKAAADIREVLHTGRIPHDLMTDAELEQHGTPERAS